MTTHTGAPAPGLAPDDAGPVWHTLSAEPAQVAEFLIGGIIRADVTQEAGLVWQIADRTTMLLPPLPNFLFQRDCSCWIFNGVTINPMTKPARQPETMIMEVIYPFHPMFTAEEFPVWLGGVEETWSPWSPAWWWPMSGIRARTPHCGNRASR